MRNYIAESAVLTEYGGKTTTIRLFDNGNYDCPLITNRPPKLLAEDILDRFNKMNNGIWVKCKINIKQL